MSIEYNPPSDIDPNAPYGYFVTHDGLPVYKVHYANSVETFATLGDAERALLAAVESNIDGKRAMGFPPDIPHWRIERDGIPVWTAAALWKKHWGLDD